MMRARSLLFLFVLVALISLPLFSVHADSVDQIQAQIDDINKQRAALDAEIAGYQKQLNQLGATHQTLQGAIKTIDVSRSKTAAQIADIQKKIAAANLKLNQLGIQIQEKEQSISLDQTALAASLRSIASADDSSIFEQVLAADTLGEAWTSVDNLLALNSALGKHKDALAEAKTVLASEHDAVKSTKTELSSANVDLATQKKALDAQKATKAQLLAQTQSQESQYQALIKQKKAEEAKFEASLFQLASQLHAANNALIPPPHNGVLAWPLKELVLTQAFGATSDSGRLYTSGTHNGIDLKASIGTPVYSALGGTVLATNEGAVQNCQYGKWILVKHENGLATLYAHLSQINVAKGQDVTTGQVIGLSGMTGYATGPHLHLTVYNASAVTFKQYSCKSGSSVLIPIAPTNAYLDPMAYL